MSSEFKPGDEVVYRIQADWVHSQNMRVVGPSPYCQGIVVVEGNTNGQLRHDYAAAKALMHAKSPKQKAIKYLTSANSSLVHRDMALQLIEAIEEKEQ